jgi:anaerobic selenocysteine-containing dehydrogenase
MLGERRLLDLLLRLGPHRLSLRKLRRSPHGIDLGPLEPRLRRILGKRRLQLAPAVFLRDLDRLEALLATPSNGLVLIGRRALRSNNSWMHNSLRLVKGPPGWILLIHPRDAAARGLDEGDRARIQSRAGIVEAPVGVTDDVMAGVVSLPHGWGHSREGAALSVAKAHAGESLNDLTDEQFVDALCGNAAFSGVPVTVTKA